jgi:hypothetical protein
VKEINGISRDKGAPSGDGIHLRLREKRKKKKVYRARAQARNFCQPCVRPDIGDRVLGVAHFHLIFSNWEAV